MYNTLLLSLGTKLYPRSLELDFHPEIGRLNLNTGSKNYRQEEKNDDLTLLTLVVKFISPNYKNNMYSL